MKFKLKYAALAFGLFAAPSYAFPVVEGASVTGSLVGVICSLVAGLTPSSKGFKAMYFTVALLLASMLYIGVDIKSDYQKSNVDEFAYLSRSLVSSPSEAIARSKPIEVAYNEEAANFSANNTDRYLNAEDFYVNEEYKDLKPVYLDYLEDGYNDQSLHAAENVQVDNIEKLIDVAKKYHGNIILFSGLYMHLDSAAYEIYKATGYRVFKSITPSNPMSDYNELVKLEAIDELWFTDYENMFSKNLIDIRSRVYELSTIENSINVSTLDFYLMTNKQIEEYLNSIDDVIFIAYSPVEYVSIHNRLKDLNVNYRFLKYGLDKTIELGYTFTPIYLNISRELDPLTVMKDYASSVDLKFICIEQKHCMNNLPAEDTFYFNIKKNGKAKTEEQIRNLPKEYRYITVSTNLETYGNSVFAGYWLNQSGRTYLGMFSNSNGFSLDYIYVDLMGKQDMLLADFKSQDELKQSVISEIRSYIAESNLHWGAVFVLFGVAFRFALLPIQVQLSKSYYFKNSQLVTGIASIGLLSLLVLAYTEMNSLILDHGIVSHLEITSFSPALKSGLSIFLTVMIVMQLWITFPTNSKIRAWMIGLIVLVYALGLIDQIVAPLIFFLVGSEITAIAIQLIYFSKFKKLEKMKGIYFTSHLATDDTLPEKWLLVNKACDADGFLVSNKADSTSVTDAISYAFKQRASAYIVRSCASDKRESSLGGYYESIKCDFESLPRIIDEMLTNELDYVWVQPYYETKFNGVVTSISSDGQGVHLVYGEGDSATEGGESCKELIIDRAKLADEYHGVFKLLTQIEKFYKSAVQLEFGFTESGKAILYQVRLIDQEKSEHGKLYKETIKGVQLNEGFMATSSRMTGSILEIASKGDIIHVAGFNYSKLSSGYKKAFASKSAINRATNELLKMHGDAMLAASPIAIVQSIESLLVSYKHVYSLTQSWKGTESISLNIDFDKLGAIDGNDLEICSARELLVSPPLTTSSTYKRRDALHGLIVWINYLLSFLIMRYANIMQVSNYPDYSLTQLKNCGLGDKVALAPYSNDSLFDRSDSASKVIVEGEINGDIYHIDDINPGDFIPPSSGQKWILVGKEIPSGWVKHLHYFSGIYSVYGHSASHLAISARELGIPYRTINTSELTALITK